MKRLLVLVAMIFASVSVVCADSHRPMKVIFDTDMGNDIDDALALDMLYKYQQEGRVELLAVMLNKPMAESCEFIDIMNNYYGYPEIPIGRLDKGATVDANPGFVRQAAANKSYKRSYEDYTTLPRSLELYRKTLEAQPDKSVTIISVGFSTNLAALLGSEADENSQLCGEDLLRRKVKNIYVMAGDFSLTHKPEFNVREDIAAAQTFFAKAPCRIVFSGFEVGRDIRYPASSILSDFATEPNHPMVEAYKNYKKMPYDRSTWDLTAVLAAVEGESVGWFNFSDAGHVVVTKTGETYFIPCPQGNHHIISVPDGGADMIVSHFVEIIGKTKMNKR